MTDLSNPNRLPLNEMTDAEIAGLIRAGREACQLDVGNGQWITKEGIASFSPSSAYRLAPKQATIDWSQVGPAINAIAMDKNWIWYGYENIPRNMGLNWLGKENYPMDGLFPSFRPGSMPWNESLIVRPGYEEDE